MHIFSPSVTLGFSYKSNTRFSGNRETRLWESLAAIDNMKKTDPSYDTRPLEQTAKDSYIKFVAPNIRELDVTAQDTTVQSLFRMLLSKIKKGGMRDVVLRDYLPDTDPARTERLSALGKTLETMTDEEWRQYRITRLERLIANKSDGPKKVVLQKNLDTLKNVGGSTLTTRPSKSRQAKISSSASQLSVRVSHARPAKVAERYARGTDQNRKKRQDEAEQQWLKSLPWKDKKGLEHRAESPFMSRKWRREGAFYIAHPQQDGSHTYFRNECNQLSESE